MTYRVRTSIFGRCILQITSPTGWRDVAEHQIPFTSFELMSRDEYETLKQRVNIADRRSAAQRKSRAERRIEQADRVSEEPRKFLADRMAKEPTK